MGSVLHDPNTEGCGQSSNGNIYAAGQSIDGHNYPHLDTRFGGGVGKGIGWPLAHRCCSGAGGFSHAAQMQRYMKRLESEGTEAWDAETSMDVKS